MLVQIKNTLVLCNLSNWTCVSDTCEQWAVHMLSSQDE